MNFKLFILFIFMIINHDFIYDAPFRSCLKKNNVLYVKIPTGIQLQTCAYGYGLFATKAFRSGEVVYQHQCYLIDDAEQEFILNTDQGNFILNSITHAVAIGSGKRTLFSFDSMMNHSCDPNTFSASSPEMRALHQYEQVACKDIHAGDQITCDYNLFEYDCRDKNIAECHCGSLNCRKEINGFKWLLPDEQIKLLPQVCSNVLEKFLKEQDCASNFGICHKQMQLN